MENASANVLKVQDGQDVFYVRPLGDVTHLYFGNDEEFVRTNDATVLHVGQLQGRPFYEEVCKFLREDYHGWSLEETKIKGHPEITLRHVDDQLVTALEGGSNYWYYLPVISKLEAPEGFKRNKQVHHSFLDKVYQGASLPVHDGEDETDKLGDLNMSNIQRGLTLLKRDYPEHYRDVVDDCGDATTADVLFQLMVMGEVVFG